MKIYGRVEVHLHALAALPEERSPHYPLYRSLGGLQSRSGRDGEDRNS